MKTSKSFKKGRAVKRYADGDYVDEPQFKVTPDMMEKSKADLSASSENETPSVAARSLKGASSEGTEEAVSEKKPEFNSFKEAYAYYKKPQNGGQGSTFDWQGKKIKVQDAVTRTETAPSVKTEPVKLESAKPSVKTEPVKLESAKPSVVKQKPVETSNSNRVPTSEEAAANRQAVYDKVKSMGRSVSDYISNFETPAERSSRERKEKTVKMASGGMVHSYKAKSHGKC